MKTKKILVIGYFGYSNNQIDGQTLRTRNIYTLLKKFSNHEVIFFDTQSVKQSKKNLFKLISLIYECDVVFNIAAHRNLKYFFPSIFIACRIARIPLNYIAIGGWLYTYLAKMPIHRYMLSKINSIFVQTENLHINLRKSGFNNVYVLNNFRFSDFPEIELKKDYQLVQRLVFMARVHPLKGVNTIFKLAEQLQSKGIKDISIDIYGPILESYETEFFSKIRSSKVNYKGVIAPNDVFKVLKEYDFMLFPTKYFTEGFPGSILDAYISGIPVVATNWLNAKEFISEGKTGYISEFNDDSAFIQLVISLIQEPIKVNSLVENLRLERIKYRPDKAWSIISKSIP